MTGLLEIKLPEHVMEHLPTDKEGMKSYLSKYVDEVIRQYETGFVRRVWGGPLDRSERAILKDFIISQVLPEELRAMFEMQAVRQEPVPLAEAK